MKKSSLAFPLQVFKVKNVFIGLLVFALVLAPNPRPTHADTPAAGIAVGLAIGFVSGLAANAAWDYLTSETTTTTTTTHTDGEGNTTTTTTTTTSKSTAAPTQPDTPGYVDALGTAVNIMDFKKGVGLTIGPTHDSADVLLTKDNISSITYKVERSIKTVLKRSSAFPKRARVPLDLVFDKLFISTRDIPGTDGVSNMKITVSANGKVLYVFKAEVRQGKMPLLSDKSAIEFIERQRKDILAISGFKKRVEFVAGPGRESDEIVVTILTGGTGKRI